MGSSRKSEFRKWLSGGDCTMAINLMSTLKGSLLEPGGLGPRSAGQDLFETAAGSDQIREMVEQEIPANRL